MASKTNISWTDKTFSPWRGCQKISKGCENCYADTFSRRNPKLLGVFGTEAQGGTRVVASDDMWRQPLKWNAQGSSRVFCASIADVFEDWSGPMLNHKGEQLYHSICGWLGCPIDGTRKNVGAVDGPVTMTDVRRRLFDLIDKTPNITWQLLTKRPENIGRMLLGSIPKLATAPKHEVGTPEANIWHRPNCWLGTTVENQENADKRLLELLKCSEMAPVLFLSMEPLLGHVDLEWPEAINPARMCCSGFDCGCQGMPTDPPILNYIQWVIVGCESGAHRRETKLEWVRSIRDQCQTWRVPFFVKQLEIDGKVTTDINQFPEDLQIQEFPNQ